MKQTLKWFTFGLGLSAGSTIGIATSMGGNDVVYESGGQRAEITQEHALAFAQVAIQAGAWNGDPVDLMRVCVGRDTTGYYAAARGLKKAPLDQVPSGATIIQPKKEE